MAVLTLDSGDKLQGLIPEIAIRMEELEAVWLQDNGSPAKLVILAFRSGETRSLDTANLADNKALINKIRGAM